ncbi:MAG: hypothetical protein LBG28_13510 [Tannerella sp.]|nr:hypothetical protein [Tannerella sp.]
MQNLILAITPIISRAVYPAYELDAARRIRKNDEHNREKKSLSDSNVIYSDRQKCEFRHGRNVSKPYCSGYRRRERRLRLLLKTLL